MSNISPKYLTKNKEEDGGCPESGQVLIPRTLIYDAECRLCVASKVVLERWDWKHRIKFLPFQSKEATKISPDLIGQNNIDAMRLVETDHPVSIGIDAFRRVLLVLPLGRVFSILFLFPGFSWVARNLYRVIAKNRIRWFGTCQYK